MLALSDNAAPNMNNIFTLPQRKALVLKRSVVESTTKYLHTIEKQSSSFLSNRSTNLLQNSPQMLSWKNPDSIYLGCSPRFAHFANLKSTTDIIGKKDSDLPWGKYAVVDTLSTEDAEVLKGHILQVLTKLPFHDRERLLLIKKMPIFNKAENIVGIMNYFTEFQTDIFQNVIHTLNDFNLETPPHLTKLIRSTFFENNLLSVREEECAHYLLQGLSSKEIGKQLQISNRTVEIHINNLKEKLQCNKTSTLIVKLVKLGYLAGTL